MIPPEIVAIFKDWPAGLLLVFLASPFLVLAGVVVKVVVDRLRDKGTQRVAEATVDVSETEAETHQFAVIITGFEASLKAVSDRATNAETRAKEAEVRATSAEARASETQQKYDGLSGRVSALERDAAKHIAELEALIPYPPGPPPRPQWMLPHPESGS